MTRISDDEIRLAAQRIGNLFINRWDMYHRQLPRGNYMAVYAPLQLTHLMEHVRGKLTLGAYLLDLENMVRYIVLDADNDEMWQKLSEVARQLVAEGIPCLKEESRRGGHLWFFLETPQPGAVGRSFGRGIVQQYELDETKVEVYPKQATTDGLVAGSMIRLPFGIHLKSGKRYGFFSVDNEELGSTVRDQLAKLEKVERLASEALYRYQAKNEEPVVFKADPRASVREGEGELLSDRITSAITVFDFVGNYVALRIRGKSATGFCPFHDDQEVRSFGVNLEGNYWSCFAGCGGGSVIHFWMKWRAHHGQDSSFVATIADLAQLLGI